MSELFFVFSFVIPIVLITLLMHKTVKKFTSLYNKKIDPNQIFSPEQFTIKYGNNSALVFSDYPKLMIGIFKILTRRYSDPELNKTVNIIRIYILVMILIFVLNCIIAIKTIYQ